MRMLSRPQECINVGCVACCGMADYEFYKGIFINNPQKCPNYKKGMLPMSVIEDIRAEIENISDKTYITFEGTTYGDRLKTSRECKEEVLEIIDKYTKGDTE